VSDRDRESNYLTNYLEGASETGTQPSWRPYLYALVGLAAVVVVGGLLFLWLS
jgi:hypothetical protein